MQYAIAAQRPLTNTQVVDLGIQLLRNMCDFETGLINWFARPTAKHTWTNFKDHFDDAYKALEKVRGKTMRNTIFQAQANSVTSAVLDQIKEDNERVRTEIRASEQKMFSMLETVIDSETESNKHQRPKEEVMFNTAASLQDYFDKRFNELEKKLTKKKARQVTDDESEGEPVKKKKKATTGGFRWNTQHYCWSCGAGNHPSKKCKKRKPGHKEAATFKNMMGGCTDYCQVVPDS